MKVEEASGRLKALAKDAHLVRYFGLALVVGLSLKGSPSEVVKREDLAAAWRKYWRPGKEPLLTDEPFNAWSGWVLAELAERGWLQKGSGDEILLRPSLAGLEQLHNFGLKELQGTQLWSVVLEQFLGAEATAWLSPNGPRE